MVALTGLTGRVAGGGFRKPNGNEETGKGAR